MLAIRFLLRQLVNPIAWLAVAALLLVGCSGSERGPSLESVAVLPFQSAGGDTMQADFAEGITRLLSAELGYVTSIDVIAANSTLRYGGAPADAAAALEVDAIVSGTATVSGDDVTLDVRLSDAAGAIVWEKRFENGVGGMTALVASAARGLADQAGASLTDREKQRLARTATNDPAAVRYALRGMREAREGAKAAAVANLEQATVTDPAYTPAYTALADLYIRQARFGLTPAEDAFESARRLANAALENDPECAEALAALAYVTFARDWNWTESEQLFQRATALNPSDVRALLGYAELLDATRNFDDAMSLAIDAGRLDPLSAEPLVMRALSLWHITNMDLALDFLKRAVELAPDSPWVVAELARLQFYTGKVLVSLRTFKRAYALAGWDEGRLEALDDAFDAQGYLGMTQERLAMARKTSGTRYVSPLDPL